MAEQADRLGKFADGFNGWRRILDSAGEQDRLAIFKSAAHEAAHFVCDGLNEIAAADELQEIAVAYGLDLEYPQDEIQSIIGSMVDEADVLRSRRIDEITEPKSNGHAAEPEPRRATPYNPPDPKDIPKRAWLYAGHYIRQTASATVAPGGYGKTSLQLFEALNMVGAGLSVWYLSGEDPRVEIDRRIAAHCERHDFDLIKAPGRLFVDDRSTFALSIAEITRSGLLRFNEAALAEFEAAITADRIDAVIIDPFISFHTVPENDNGSIDAVVKRLALIAVRTDSAIELSHHVRKTFGLRELTVEDARGGSAIINAVRSGRVINRMSTSEAERAGVPQDKRHFFIRLDIGKRNMAPPEKARWFDLENVELPNGDNVQVIVSWQFPGETDAVNAELADMVRGLLARQPYRADTRSAKWLGIAIGKRMNLNINETGDIKKIQRVIGNLIKANVVKKTELRDEDTRKKAVFYVAGDAPDNVVRLFPDDNGDN